MINILVSSMDLMRAGSRRVYVRRRGTSRRPSLFVDDDSEEEG
jgi:hypothetical protein